MILHPTHACPDFLESFSDFIDGTLPPARRAAIQAHLDCCEGCLGHLAAYRRGIAALENLPETEVEPAAFWARLQHRLWHEALTDRAVRRSGWRVPFAALSTAAVAIAVIWAGLRIGAGLERVAERAETPIVVVAEPRPVDDTPAPVVSRPAPTGSVVGASPRPVQLASAIAPPGSRAETRSVDPVTEREFQALRARIETEAWLGPPEPAVTRATFEPAGLRSYRDAGPGIRAIDVRSSLTRP